MKTLGQTKTRIVKVVAGLSRDKIMPALIQERNKAGVYQYLNGDAKAQMGDDIVAYFAAERIGPLYYLGERQKGGWSW